MDEPDGWYDESVYKFRLRCEGFFDLCGGLLKLHNICGPSKGIEAEAYRALDAHRKICQDLIGTGE